MNQTEFSKAIDALGLTQVGAGRFLGVDPRTWVDMSPANCRFRPPQRCCFA
jgi:hypothetical protein